AGKRDVAVGVFQLIDAMRKKYEIGGVRHFRAARVSKRVRRFRSLTVAAPIWIAARVRSAEIQNAELERRVDFRKKRPFVLKIIQSNQPIAFRNGREKI